MTAIPTRLFQPKSAVPAFLHRKDAKTQLYIFLCPSVLWKLADGSKQFSVNHNLSLIIAQSVLVKGIFLALLLGINGVVWGQAASSYTFTAASGTYSALTGTTNTSLGATDDEGLSLAITLPFTFIFGGSPYSQIKVSSNGWLTFGSATNAYYQNNTTNANNAKPILFPLWDDLQNIAIPVFVTTGSAPNRIFKLEWPQQEWNYQSGGHVISFQVWLYEGTNIIEFIYNRGSDGVNSGSASIGIYDAAGTYLTLNGSGTSPTAQSGTFTTNISSKPANGQIYRFTPATASYRAYFYNMDYGSASWCAGETRTISVTVKNAGTATWTSSPGGSINFSYWWSNQGQDSNPRLNPFSGLAPGQQQTVSMSVTAPATSGSYFLTFDLVNELNCWFRNNDNLCGPGNITYSSGTITVITAPSPPTASGTSVCSGLTATLSASGAGAGEGYKWYDQSSGGNLLTTGSSYVTPALTAGTTYYVRKYNTTSLCESASTAVTVTVNSLPSFSVTKTDLTCFNAGNGTITISASGGSGGYQFSIDKGSGWEAWQSNPVFGSLGSGTYQLKIKDSNGCVQTNCTVN